MSEYKVILLMDLYGIFAYIAYKPYHKYRNELGLIDQYPKDKTVFVRVLTNA